MSLRGPYRPLFSPRYFSISYRIVSFGDPRDGRTVFIHKYSHNDIIFYSLPSLGDFNFWLSLSLSLSLSESTIRYDKIEEINVDSKAEYTA